MTATKTNLSVSRKQHSGRSAMTVSHAATSASTDTGFDTPFTTAQLEELRGLMSNDAEVEGFVERLHRECGAVDLKRGEYYPELLRATLSMRQQIATVMGVDFVQAQPNFGSNGSIDAVFTAARLFETESARAWEARRSAEIAACLDDEMLDRTAMRERLEALESSRPGHGVLVATPTYFRNYNSAASKGLTIHSVPVTADHRFDTDSYIEALEAVQPTVAVLVTPNNPTGVAIPDADLRRVLDALPEGTWCMLDRTLVNCQDEVSTRELLDQYAHVNLVVLHSFSKYKGMSQHRVGVALYSNPEFAQQLEPMLPLCLSLEGIVKAMHWIERDGGFVPNPQTVEHIRENRVRMEAFVAAHPRFSITDFSGNYTLITLPDELDSYGVSDALAEVGLYVMPGHAFPEPNARVVRIHVGGAPEHVRTLTDALATLDLSARAASTDSQPIARLVLAIFRRHLGNDEATGEDDFFDLGGDSFLAMEVVAEVTRELGFPLELAVLLDSKTIGEVISHVQAGVSGNKEA